MLLVCVNVLCKMAAAAYFVANNMDFRNKELLFAFLGFLIYARFLYMNPLKMIFTYLLVVDYLLIVRGISSFVIVQLFHKPSFSWASSLICILLYCVFLPLLLRFFRKASNQLYLTNAPQLWRIIWLIPALFSVLTLIFTNSYQESSAGQILFLLCRISLMLCMFVICSVLLQALDSLQKQISLEQQLIFEKN